MAEDDPRDVELTLAALEEYSLANRVVVVRDGVEALEYLFRTGNYSTRKECNPVLVLLDIKMPRVDGLEVLRRVKADPSLKTVPVVALTSSNQDKDLLESYRLGVNAYVVKPVAFDRFMEAVKQIGLFWVLMNRSPDRLDPKPVMKK